jgi:hypothetical protein
MACQYRLSVECISACDGPTAKSMEPVVSAQSSPRFDFALVLLSSKGVSNLPGRLVESRGHW